MFKSFEIAFGKALKHICGLLFYTSNHWVANYLVQFLFKNNAALHQARFIKNLQLYKSQIFILNAIYLKSGF